MKSKIIKRCISENGFYERQLLVSLNERSLIKFLIIRGYRKLLKLIRNIEKAEKQQKNNLERISDCFDKIGFKSRFKASFRKKRSFKPVKTLILIAI